MESYIVRVYRRDPKEPARMSGLVEIVESRARRAFHGSEELWAILAEAGRTALSDPGDPIDRRAGAPNAGLQNGGDHDH